MYFRQLAPFYSEDDWSDLELLTLDLYVQCLRRLERNADYVLIGLKTVAKRIQGNAALQQQSPNDLMKPANIRQASASSASSLTSILNTSKLLNEQISLSTDGYFDRIDMGMYVRHSNDDDAFEFPLVLQSLLPESFLAESVRVQILSVEEVQRSDLWLHANDISIEPGMCKIWLRSNVSLLGPTVNAAVAHKGHRQCSRPGTSWIRSPFFLQMCFLSTVFLRHPMALRSQRLDTRQCLNSTIDDACCFGPTQEAWKLACLIPRALISIDQNQLL